MCAQQERRKEEERKIGKGKELVFVGHDGEEPQKKKTNQYPMCHPQPP